MYFYPYLISRLLPCAAGTIPRLLCEGAPAFDHLTLSSDEAKMVTDQQ